MSPVSPSCIGPSSDIGPTQNSSVQVTKPSLGGCFSSSFCVAAVNFFRAQAPIELSRRWMPILPPSHLPALSEIITTMNK